ncbi:MAG TPA: lactonase family protein [Paludibacter sp.]|nr:lactonase family protein [Paludibacter sp.]
MDLMRKIPLSIFLLVTACVLPAQNKSYRFLLGTYTHEGKSEGIYSYVVDTQNWTFERKDVQSGIQNPSYLAFSPDCKFVYSVSEGDEGSAVYAYSFGTESGKLKFINSSLTRGAAPCFILSTGKHVVTANYNGGSISVFGQNSDGSLTGLKQIIRHTGHSINAERQGEPHVHQVTASPNGKYILSTDLGTDYVTVYQYNKEIALNPPTEIEGNRSAKILSPYDSLKVKPGSGPRHLVLGSKGKKLFLLQEIDGTVSVIGMKNGKLKWLDETTVDHKPGTANRAADIHLSSDERFLYATNRGSANDITCFSVSKKGKLAFVQQISTGGSGPRNFAITPDGKYLFVANQETGNIVVFERDRKSGMLANTGKQLHVGLPVCVLFY